MRYTLLPEQVSHVEKMKPGDVIACSGSSVICKLIQWVSGYPYSHVAIIHSVINEGNKTKVMIAESNWTSASGDDKSPTRFLRGVQMHWLHKYLDCDEGVWWVPLKEPLREEELKPMIEYMDEVYDSFTKYDWPGIIGIGLDLITGLDLFDQPDFERLFCSEFVTNSLIHSGRISKDINPSKQTPGSVVDSPCFEVPIKLK